MDPSVPPPLIGIFRFAARYESKWNRAFGRHNPSGQSFRGGFMILQRKKMPWLWKASGIVTAALHACQPTPLLTRPFHH